MANVKISNLPAEPDVNNILGFAGYNAGGTCKISGADLINTLPSSTPTLGDVLTAGDEAIDQEIFFKPTSDARVLRLDKNGLSMNNFATDLLITANSGGRLFLNSNSNDVVVQALGTGQVVFNTAEIDLQSGDVIDSTSSAGSAGEVLSSLGAGNGTQWVTPSAQKFVLTLAYAFDQTTTTFTVRNLAWNGNVNMSGASTVSVDDGSWYVNNSFNITKVISRYAGRASLTMGGTDNLTLELKYLTPSSIGPNSWSAVSNDPTSPSTLITDFGNNLDLTLADNATYPFKTFTPGAPITINADTMLVCTATETSSLTPSATDYFIQIYCEYV